MPEMDRNQLAMKESAGEVNSPRRSKTILLVDDEQIVRQITREILELENYRVLEAANGREALEVCRNYDNPIDLVMTDISMPQMGGQELVEKLGPLLPETKILYMSGYMDDTDAHQGAVEEERYFLEKPFDPTALLKKVREVLDLGSMKAHA
jgi:two-component system cell cycle sensor histidine kinase/response regulator CckA